MIYECNQISLEIISCLVLTLISGYLVSPFSSFRPKLPLLELNQTLLSSLRLCATKASPHLAGRTDYRWRVFVAGFAFSFSVACRVRSHVKETRTWGEVSMEEPVCPLYFFSELSGYALGYGALLLVFREQPSVLAGA